MSIQEALVSMFTDDPRNWVKWGIVFAILIGGYVIAIPLYNKITAGLSWERKRDIAKSKDHIIKASLVNKHPSGEVSRYNWRATYRYTLQGEERQYTAYFKHPGNAAPVLVSLLHRSSGQTVFLRGVSLRKSQKPDLVSSHFSALDLGRHCPRPPACGSVGVLKKQIRFSNAQKRLVSKCDTNLFL